MKTVFRKTASVVIASSMLFSGIAAFADESTTVNNTSDLQQLIAEKAEENGITYNVPTTDGGTGTAEVVLDADTKVKTTAATEYRDRYISASTSYSNILPTLTLTGDFVSTLDMSKVRSAFNSYKAAAEAYAEANPLTATLVQTVPVNGTFQITVTYDAEMSMTDETIAYHTEVGSMNGFNDTAKEIFVDTAREIKDGAWKVDAEGNLTEQTVANTEKTYKTLVIDVKVKAPSEAYQGIEHTGSWADTLVYADLDQYCDDLLGDISYNVDEVTVGPDENLNQTTYYTESISMAGSITIGNSLSTISFYSQQLEDAENNYTGVEDWQDISATMALVKTSSSGSSGGGSSSGSTSGSGGGGSSSGSTSTATDAPSASVDTTPDPDATTDPNATADPNATDDPNATADPNGSGSNTPSATSKPFVPTNSTVPSALNGEDHMVYVIGYPEGDVRPLRSISREEIATIFYRLLKDDVRDSIYTKESDFTDVLKSRWSNKAIATMANGGYVNGDAGTTNFRPADAITRAEFIAVATRFLDDPSVEGYNNDFSDISGHWAEENIKEGVAAGWLSGYEDGTFRPDQQITRAEAMTIINRVLVRYVNEDGLIDGYVQWPDNPSDAWYYYNVIEATNSHEYAERTFETPADFYETWTSMIDNWIWGDFKAAYEDPDEIDKQ